MIETLQSLHTEPRIVNTPRFVWRDWVLVAALLTLVVVELIVRNDINAVIPSVILTCVAACALPWRRTHPTKVGTGVMGAIIAFDIVSVAAGYGPFNIYSSALVLIVMYSTFRWGSGRDMEIVWIVSFVLFVVSNATEWTGIADAISGFFVLQFAVGLGIVVRLTTQNREHAREQVRMGERERLARELHDTVAHHMSAIAIQAQAGRFVAESGSLEGAAQALEVIEEEASRTLSEMRSIVGALRDAGEVADLAPQHGMHDIDTLAGDGPPLVVVNVDPGAHHVVPALGTAIYRIAQESITNARRHATNPTKVVVRVEDLPAQVRLTVTDDGTATAAIPHRGFGIVGMTERATLLGGTLSAGPGTPNGWQVVAVLPKHTGV